MKILLVEDDRAVRDMLAATLQHYAFELFLAQNGEEAFDALDKHKPDVMITDIVMPKKNGLALIRHAKEAHPDVKIIAMSGGGREGPADYLKSSKTFGADIVFEKPVANAALIKAIQDFEA